MRNPKVVLDNLFNQSRKNENYVFEKIYRNLYNVDFYLMAYGRIYHKQGNMTSGIDGNTIDGMGLERIRTMIEKMKKQNYQPNPAKRTYIPKKNSNDKRPLGIPSFEDKLVQEVIRLILEAIYEPNFSDRSHGFRVNRSCHTALIQAKKVFNGAKWWVEGDIKGFFDSIDHHILIKLLRKRIKDEKFINLIWKFLKTGYIEDWKYHNTYSGTPQGGIVSPILANIYLNELDKFMEKYKNSFDKGKSRADNKEYNGYKSKIANINSRFKRNPNMSNELKQILIQERKKLYKQRSLVDVKDPMDENFKRIQYVRYADDFLIGVIGSKFNAEQVKKDIGEFLEVSLKLELSLEKTLITNSREKAGFLGYDVAVSRSKDNVKSKNRESNRKGRLLYNKVMLYMPLEAWTSKVKGLKAGKFAKNGVWKPNHRKELVNLDDLEILDTYNSEIRGIYNYFKLAINVSSLNSFMFFMRYSLLKTFAAKYRTRVTKIIRKYCENKQVNLFRVIYKTKQGTNVRYIYNDGFKHMSNIIKNVNVDSRPNTLKYAGRNSTIKRLLAETCEHCGATNVPIEMHHVRKLKELKGKKTWERAMIARQRKTLALCKKCHVDLHAGRLD
ncbi:reverse transcriptase domain-containing protein (plasmid) [Bacillus thuringiensis]|uniref:reverse transcriptase/maturase family protein n=1 Tax=Bacillus thuringiensis TaxID=1428 RepID=UPI0022241B94|nr:reverse transcriptase/maturase family protein [Bacillus thuringiensis]UYX55839.1 reverse transcriptase domain-containing protein [Bacillus thuringiensis]